MQKSDWESESKRQIFHKEIRRKQLDSIFAQKRQILTHQQLQAEQEIEQQLEAMHMQLIAKNDLENVLFRMGNYTFEDACLARTAGRMGKDACDELCLKIVYQLLNVTISSLWGRSELQDTLRKYCLIIISNLTADRQAPHNDLVPIISEALCSVYVSVTQWGRDPETIQIGWIVSNIFFQEIEASMELEKPIEDLLGWAEELIMISNPDMLDNLYRSLTKYFLYVDSFHAVPVQEKEKEKEKVEHFQVHRLILIQNTVEYNIHIEMGTSLIPILEFLKQNTQYLPACEETCPLQVVHKVMQVVRAGASEKFITKGLELVTRIVRHPGKEGSAIAQLLLKKYRDCLSNNLLYQSTNIKIKVIELMQRLCLFSNRETLSVLYREMGIEPVFNMLVHNGRESSTIIELLRLLHTLLQRTDGREGWACLSIIDQHLSCRGDEVGFLAQQLLNDFDFNVQK